MLPFKIAWQFIIRSPLQNVITVLTIIIGVGIQFFILSIGETLTNIILEHTTAYNEHIIINANGTNFVPLTKDQALKQEILEQIPEIELFNYMLSIDSVSISTDFIPPVKFTVRAIDDENGFKFYGLTEEKHLTSGTFPTEPNQILLTKQFANQYMIQDMDWITLTYSPSQNQVYTVQYQVSGTFDLGLFRQTFAYCIVLFSDLPPEYDLHSVYGVVQITDPRDAQKIADQIKPYFNPDDFDVQTWKDLSPEIYLLDTAQVLAISLIQVFISFAVFIVVASILGFSVHQKSKQLGILKAMGLRDKNISLVFLLQSFILGFIGTIGGLIGGTIFISIYQDFMTYDDGTPRVILRYDWSNYVISGFVIAITVLLASLISIRRAKKVSIIELIKT